MHDHKWKNKKVYQVWIFFLESIVASGVDVKIDIFPRAPGHCCKNKSKTTRPEAIDRDIESIKCGTVGIKPYIYLYMYS